MSYRAAVHNLGCKVNSYELDVMVQELTAAGYEMVSFEESADVYIVNTCSVTSIADRKSRQMLHRAKHLNPDAMVVAVGCYVETDRARLEADPLVDLCVGNNRKGSIAAILRKARERMACTSPSEGFGDQEDQSTELSLGGASAAGRSSVPDKTLSGSTMADLTDHPEYESMQLFRPGRTRADVKIQDGCNQFCSYCIIPYARGRIRSRNPEEVVSEIRHLADAGTAEVVLTGIHISSYGRETGRRPEEALLELLTRIQLLAGIRRIRLGSLEPRIMTEDFVSGIRRLSKICPHFHLSLQSGCDDTLRRMNRHYTVQQYRDSVRLLREQYGDPAITTDIIVGFPGETQEEFLRTMDFVREIGFYEVHVFRYSERKGTAAVHFPNPCSAQEKAQRSTALLELTRAQAQAFREGFLGKREELLLEEEVQLGEESYFAGRTARYVEGLATARGHHAGELVSGIVTGILPESGRLMLQEEL